MACLVRVRVGFGFWALGDEYIMTFRGGVGYLSQPLAHELMRIMNERRDCVVQGSCVVSLV